MCQTFPRCPCTLGSSTSQGVSWTTHWTWPSQLDSWAAFSCHRCLIRTPCKRLWHRRMQRGGMMLWIRRWTISGCMTCLNLYLVPLTHTLFDSDGCSTASSRMGLLTRTRHVLSRVVIVSGQASTMVSPLPQLCASSPFIHSLPWQHPRISTSSTLTLHQPTCMGHSRRRSTLSSL